MITDIHSEDRLVQATFADHLRDVLGRESVFAHNEETFVSNGTLVRSSERDVVLNRDLRTAVQRLNPELPASFHEQNASRQFYILSPKANSDQYQFNPTIRHFAAISPAGGRPLGEN